MAITISPLTEYEVPDAVRTELEAFRSHPRIPALWPRGYTTDLFAYHESKKREGLSDPDRRFIKALDVETGTIIGVSAWTFELDPSRQAEKEPTDPKAQPPANWPLGGNWEMRQFFDLNSERWAREYLGGKPYIQLDILVVNPKFQKRGVGSRLLSWGVEQANKMAIPIGLESTPAGSRLYESFGFGKKDVLRADMKQFGFHETYDEEAAKRIWMIREPSNQQ